MKKMFLWMVVAVGIMGLMAGAAMAAGSTDSVNINLLVTPLVRVDLNASPTYYNFGSVPLKTSTCSVTALTLTNAGNVGITVDKTVWTNETWDITLSSTQTNGYDLWAMVKSGAAPGQVDFENAKSSFNESGLQALNPLTTSLAAAVTMNPEQAESLWFRLDMPKYVSSEKQRTIHVRLKATARQD